jgi:hypothetical protein
MTRFLAPVLFVVACLAQAAGNPPPKEPPQSDSEKEVRAVARAVREATARRDGAALKPLLADTFTGLTPVGTRYDRAEWVEGVTKGGLLATRPTRRRSWVRN